MWRCGRLTKSKESKIVELKNSNLKHEENIRRWTKAIQEASRVVSENKDKIKQLEAEGEFYVYLVYVDAVPRYVGKGKKARYKHAVSGSSSCPELNRDYFQGKYIEVVFVETLLTEENALRKEQDWIGQVASEEVELYNKSVPARFHYWDESMRYFYHHWFKHACDNLSAGAKRVVPEY